MQYFQWLSLYSDLYNLSNQTQNWNLIIIVCTLLIFTVKYHVISYGYVKFIECMICMEWLNEIEGCPLIFIID